MMPRLLLFVLLVGVFSEPASAGVLANIAAELQAMSGPLVFLIRMFGFIMIIAAMLSAPHLFRTGGGSIGSALLAGSLIVGSLLINLSFWIRGLQFTVYGMSNVTEAENILMEIPTRDTGPQEFVFFSLVVIALVGIAGVVRGTWLMRGGKGGQGRSMGSAFTHLLGGTLAINFLSFLQLLAVTAGESYNEQFLEFFGSFLGN
ncbi:hypothetical protein [Thiolapillus sp.]|nr:hypothetical protein [Thiolapillus sp.]